MQKVNHPDYYQTTGGAEIIDIIEELPFNRGNIVKYVCRAGKKDDEIQDLEKALWYLNREIARVKSRGSVHDV